MSRETEDLVRAVLVKKHHTKLTLANLLEVDWAVIDAWEQGTGEPSLDEVRRLGEILHGQA